MLYLLSRWPRLTCTTVIVLVHAMQSLLDLPASRPVATLLAISIALLGIRSVKRYDEHTSKLYTDVERTANFYNAAKAHTPGRAANLFRRFMHQLETYSLRHTSREFIIVSYFAAGLFVFMFPSLYVFLIRTMGH